MYDINKEYKVVIIDSGVKIDHPAFSELTINGFGYSDGEINDNYYDEFGHGTAIFNSIKNGCHSEDILNIKLGNVENGVDEFELINLLHFIYDNVKTKCIHMSLGLTSLEHYSELEELCGLLEKKNIVIISAFDNNGRMSYPAAFSSVIGVTTSYNCAHINDFEYYPDKYVNIGAKGSVQKVAWSEPSYILIGGNSFAAANVTSHIFKSEIQFNNKQDILDYFKDISITETMCERIQETDKMRFKIEKAALFPFSKEMHSLLRYSELLNFNIETVYDVRQSMHVGAHTNTLLHDVSIKNIRIENIDKIDWSLFDTIIIGHFYELSKFFGKEYQKGLIISALEKGKNVFSFDNIYHILDDELLSKYKDRIYSPVITSKMVPPNRFGKLFEIQSPVVGVFGTSSKQGKYTLQLYLRKRLIEAGYSIGQIGTEPTALLFGMDYSFPIGFDSTVYIHGDETIRYLNNCMKSLSTNNDIIIVGSQSGTVPYDLGNIQFIPISQNDFIFGTQPDAVILCVNPYDEFEYIKRTVDYIESIIDSCKVISLVVFPVDIDENIKLFNKKIKLSYEKYKRIKEVLEELLSIPVFLLGDNEEMNRLYNNTINYFSED